MLTLTLFLIFVMLGALLSRMDGGGLFELPLGLESWAYSAPYLILMLLATSHVTILNISLVIGLYLLTVMFKRTGHGSAMDLGTQDANKPDAREKLEFLWAWVPRGYWHDFVGLFILGALISAPTTLYLAAMTGNILVAILPLIGGSFKAIAYAIGWEIRPKMGTEIGEYLTGAFAYIGLGLSYILLRKGRKNDK